MHKLVYSWCVGWFALLLIVLYHFVDGMCCQSIALLPTRPCSASATVAAGGCDVTDKLTGWRTDDARRSLALSALERLMSLRPVSIRCATTTSDPTADKLLPVRSGQVDKTNASIRRTSAIQWMIIFCSRLQSCMDSDIDVSSLATISRTKWLSWSHCSLNCRLFHCLDLSAHSATYRYLCRCQECI